MSGDCFCNKYAIFAAWKLSVDDHVSFVCTCAVPGVPRSVNGTSPSPTSLLVTWEHPLAPDRNGIITGYTVIIQTDSKMNTTELFSNDTSLLLTGLVPFTDYNITVAGNTSAGQGEFTMPFIMRTLNDSGWRLGYKYSCIMYMSITQQAMNHTYDSCLNLMHVATCKPLFQKFYNACSTP